MQIRLSPATIIPYIRRLIILVCGLFTCSVGIVCTYRSDLGLGPWDVFHQGLSRHTPLSFGVASICTGAFLILAGLFLKVRPGIGTILNMLLIGLFVDFQLHNNWLLLISSQPVLTRLGANLLGVFLVGLGTALYITPGMGAGPRDGLMIRLHMLTRLRIAIVRAAIECSALLVGFLLGGTLGIGTLIFAFGVGPAVEAGFWLVKKVHLASGKPATPTKEPVLLTPDEVLETEQPCHSI